MQQQILIGILIYIYNDDPDYDSEEIDDYTWQNEHRIDSFESDSFCKEVLRQAIKNKPAWSGDFKYLLNHDFEKNESISMVSKKLKIKE